MSYQFYVHSITFSSWNSRIFPKIDLPIIFKLTAVSKKNTYKYQNETIIFTENIIRAIKYWFSKYEKRMKWVPECYIVFNRICKCSNVNWLEYRAVHSCNNNVVAFDLPETLRKIEKSKFSVQNHKKKWKKWPFLHRLLHIFFSNW